MFQRTVLQPDLVALASAPILMSAAMLLDLTPSADDTTGLLALVGDSPDRWMWANATFLLAAVAWTTAAIGLFRRLGQRSRSIAVGAIALAAGGAALGLIEATMAYLPGLAQSGASVAEQVAVVEQLDSSAPAMVFELVHIVGWLGGLLLVVTGLFLTRVVPRWVPATVFAGLVGVIVFVSGPGLAVAGAVMAAGTTALAMHLARPDRASSFGVQTPTSVGAGQEAPR